MRRSQRWPLEETEDEATQAEDGEKCACPIDCSGSRRILRLLHVSRRQHDDNDRQRNVDEENRAPADMFDEPPTKHWSERRRDRAEPRPRSDCSASLFSVKRRGDDRETPRDQERSPDSLNRASDDQYEGVGCQSAQYRRHREQSDAGKKHFASAELIAE